MPGPISLDLWGAKDLQSLSGSKTDIWRPRKESPTLYQVTYFSLLTVTSEAPIVKKKKKKVGNTLLVTAKDTATWPSSLTSHMKSLGNFKPSTSPDQPGSSWSFGTTENQNWVPSHLPGRLLTKMGEGQEGCKRDWMGKSGPISSSFHFSVMLKAWYSLLGNRGSITEPSQSWELPSLITDLTEPPGCNHSMGRK